MKRSFDFLASCIVAFLFCAAQNGKCGAQDIDIRYGDYTKEEIQMIVESNNIFNRLQRTTGVMDETAFSGLRKLADVLIGRGDYIEVELPDSFYDDPRGKELFYKEYYMRVTYPVFFVFNPKYERASIDGRPKKVFVPKAMADVNAKKLILNIKIGSSKDR